MVFTLRVNDLSLYSSSLGIVNAVEGITGKKLKYTYTTLVIGILGTTLSVLGILDRFVDFLTVLGVVFPPIIGIMLVDYSLLCSSRKILDDSQLTGKLPDETVTIGWAPIGAQYRWRHRRVGYRSGGTDHQLTAGRQPALLGAKAGVQPRVKAGHHARPSVIIEPPSAGANY